MLLAGPTDDYSGLNLVTDTSTTQETGVTERCSSMALHGHLAGSRKGRPCGTLDGMVDYEFGAAASLLVQLPTLFTMHANRPVPPSAIRCGLTGAMAVRPVDSPEGGSPVRPHTGQSSQRTAPAPDSRQCNQADRAKRIRAVAFRNSHARPIQIPHSSAVKRWRSNDATNVVRHR